MAVNENQTNQYLGKKINVPFYDPARGAQIVKLRIKRTKLGANTRNANHPKDFSPTDKDFIRTRAAKRFIAHYFPEFYTFLYDQQVFSTFPGANTEVAQDLIDSIKNSIVLGRVDDAPEPGRIIIVALLTYDIEKKRESIKSAKCLPSFEDNLMFFNEEQKITNILSQATYAIGSIGATNSNLNDGLQAFNTQMAGLEGQLQFSPNMGMLASTTQSALSLTLTLVASQLKATSPSYKFGSADSMTIYFGTQENANVPGGSQIAIGRIEYLKIEESITPQPMKIGYFTNMRYNNTLKDPLTLITLKNYDSILASLSAPGGPSDQTGGASGFMNFMRNPEVQNALTPHEAGGSASSIFNPSSPLTPTDKPGNPFINAAKELGGIDVENTDELEKGFKTAFSSKELKALKAKLADNPEVFTKVFNEQKSKQIQNAVDVTKVVESVLETGPFGFVEKNPQIDNFLKMFGVKDLAKEAMICLTMGLNFEIGRLTKAVRRALTEEQASLYQRPRRPGADITKPYQAPEDFKMFFPNGVGDIWKQVLDTIIDTLQQSVLQMIKKLGDILKYNCPLNNPRSQDFGANDITDLIPPDLETPSLAGAGSALDQVAANQGMSPSELRAYLSAISLILSSMDICSLFTRRATVGPEILDRIIEFNSTYSLPYVSGHLTTYSTILAFFAETSLLVDVTELCNEVINEVYFANQENINFCLTPGNLPTVAVAEVVDMMENGIQLEFPVLNFDCPDRENFINNPTITISVPELFNTLTQLVELQFVESAESVKTIMLEQKFTSETNGSLMRAFVDANLQDYGANGWPPSMDPAFMTKLIEVLDSVSGAADQLESCDVDLSQILGPEAAAAIGAAGDVTGVVADTMSDPAFLSAIEEIKNKLMGIGGPNGLPTTPGPIFPSYRFNTEFLKEFINYIEIGQLAYVNSTVTMPQYFSSRTIDDARLFISGTIPPNLEEAPVPISDGSYKPVEINFGFPTTTPFLFGGLGTAGMPTAVAGIGTVNCLSQNMINLLISMGMEPAEGAGCPNTTHAPPEGSYEPPEIVCVDQTFVEIIVYNLLLLNPAVQAPDLIGLPPSFEVSYPLMFKQIKYASQRIKRIPMRDMTPMMLNIVQSYFIDNFLALKESGYLSYLITIYEQAHGCELDVILADVIDLAESLASAKIQLVHDAIMEVDISDLSTTQSHLKIIYPREAEGNPNIYVDFESAGDYIPKQQILEDISRSLGAQVYETNAGLPDNTYIKAFTDTFLGTNISTPTPPIQTQDPNGNPPLVPIQGMAGINTDANGNTITDEDGDPIHTSVALVPEIRSHIESKHFPTVYALLVDNLFNYVITNGVFDAAALQSLTLFHLNENCPPAEVKDLLDIDGIMAQMKKEYVQAMCADKPELPDRAIIRNVVEYGMYLLITQMQIAQIFIKNIFVLSAFEIDSLLDNKDSFIFKFLRKQITTSLLNFIANSENRDEAEIRTDLVNYFNLKIRRENIVAEGGIRNALGDLVFPVGTTFSVADTGAFVGFDEILDYLISERLLLGAVPVANAIRAAVSGNNPVSLDHAMLASLQTFTVASENREFLMSKIGAYYADADQPRIFLTRKYVTLAGGLERARMKMWYYYGGDQPNLVNIFKFPGTIPAFGRPNVSTAMMESIQAGLLQASAVAGQSSTTAAGGAEQEEAPEFGGGPGPGSFPGEFGS